MSIRTWAAVRSCARAGLAGLAALAALSAFGALTACGTGPMPRSTDGGSHDSAVTLACTTTVHGVVEGRGSISAAWLPPGYSPQPESAPASPLPASAYAKVTGHPDQPRIMLNSSYQAGPVTGADGGAGKGTPVRIQGHGGLIESGPPAPQLVGVYWKPSAGFLVSVVGYNVGQSVVLQVARHVSFAAPGIIALPVMPGPIVTRQAAIASARRAAARSAGGPARLDGSAKLSSWTEIAAVAARAQQNLAPPPGLAASPWRPVWAVLLTGTSTAPTVVVVDAASGRAEFTVHERGSWFTALTDRAMPASGHCPGGSSARVPFGVLTRSEQEYAEGSHSPGIAAKSSVSRVEYVLSTVSAVNAADPSLYGGCIQQDCSIDELVWVTITTVRADPGKTVACLPGGVSVPSGYHAKRVREYYSVSVPDNVAIGCRPLPAQWTHLQDLAPPVPADAGRS